MKRKFLASVLSLAMILTLVPTSVSAEDVTNNGSTSQIEATGAGQEQQTDATTDASQNQNADASENEENQQATEAGKAQENQSADSQEEANSADSESEAADQVATYSAETQTAGIPADAVHIDSSNAEEIGAGTYYYDAASAKSAKQVEVNGGTKENPTIIYMSGEINLTLNDVWMYVNSGYVKFIGVNGSKVTFNTGGSDYAIYIRSTDTVTMENLDVENANGYDIVVSNPNNTLLIKDCKFISSKTCLYCYGKLFIDGKSEFECNNEAVISLTDTAEMYLLDGTIKGYSPLSTYTNNVYLLGGKLISTRYALIWVNAFEESSSRIYLGDTKLETSNGLKKWINLGKTYKFLHFMQKGETVEYSMDGKTCTYKASKDFNQNLFLCNSYESAFTFADGSPLDKTIKEDKEMLYRLTSYNPYGEATTSIGYKDGELYFYKHTHNFTLSKTDDNTITAKCTGTDSGKSKCNFQNDADLKFVLDAENSDTPGTTYNGLNVTDNITGLTGKTVSYTYYLDENLTEKTTSANSGAATEGAAPANAGTYWVAATIDKLTVKDSFTIKSPKVEGKVEAAQDQITYDGTAQTLVKGESAEGTIFYRLGKDGEWSEKAPTAKDAGTYTVFYYIKANSSDAGENNGSAEDPAGFVDVTIAKKTVTVSGVKANNKTYDGTTDAALDFSDVKIDGVVSGDKVTAKAKGTFNSKDVKDAKTVTISDWTIGGASAGNYEISTADSQKTVEASITPKTVELKWSDSKLTYKDAPYTVTAEVTNKASADDTFKLAYAENSKTDVGDYTAKVTGLGNDNYTLDGAENVTKSWSISYLETKAEASLTTDPDGTNGWYRTGVTVKPADGYQISEDGKTWKDSLSYNEDGTFTKGYYLKDADGYITGEKEISFKIDRTAPTGSIKIGENSFDKLLNKITFGHFFKDHVEAIINGTDAVSGIAKTEYQKVAKGGTFDKNGGWTTGDSLKMTANDKSVIYVRLTDEAGNQSIINSDGIVVYTDVSTEAAEVKYTRTSRDDVSTGVQLNGNTVKEIKLGETVLDPGAYEVNKDGYLVLKNAYLSQLTAGNYEFTVSYNPYGEIYVSAEGNQAPKGTKIRLEVEKAAGKITSVSDISATYTGESISQPTIETPSKGQVTVEYKAENSADDTYTTEAPTNAGAYVARITVAADGDYEAVTETIDFEISPKPVTITANPSSSTFGQADAELTYTIDGALENTPLTDITIERKPGENAGEYDIIVSQKKGSNPNYEITFVNGTYTVEPLNLEDVNVNVSLGKALISNGKEQEQLVKEATLLNEDGTVAGVIPTDGYTVEENKATEPGTYTLKIAGKGNYKGAFEKTFYVAPASGDEYETDENGDVKIGGGHLSLETKVDGNALPTTILTKKTDLLQMLIESGDLSADELSEIASGVDTSIEIVLKVTDISSAISAETKALMEKGANGYTIGQYVDISLYKYITIGQNDTQETQLFTTAGKIKISVQIPENLINTDNSKTREYAVVRNHDGKVEVLNGTYDANAKTFTFETDKFSDYAVAYKDTAKAGGAKVDKANKQAKDQKKSGNAKTGDTNDLVLWLLTAVLAALIATLIMELRRRKRHE